jgi:hypothetical protein
MLVYAHEENRSHRCSAMVLLSAGSGHSQGQSSASFQCVATVGGDLRGLSTPYTAHPGSRQFVYFSNDKLTITATIEVEDTRGGVALVRVRTKSYPGTVDRETSKKELKSALQREYTYVPTEELSLAVDGGGALSLVGAIADESGNLSKPIAPLPVGPEAGQIMLMSPALLCGDRVMANLKVVAGTGVWPPWKPGHSLVCSAGGPVHFCSSAFRRSYRM